MADRTGLPRLSERTQATGMTPVSGAASRRASISLSSQCDPPTSAAYSYGIFT